MAIESTSAAPVNTMPRARISRSFEDGITTITSAPATGSNVVIVMAEFSQVIEASLPLSRDSCEDDGERDHADEHQGGVALHVTGLEVPQDATGLARDVADAVHRSVDHTAVEDHHELRQAASHRGRAVHHGIEHVLVEPVHGGRRS